MPPHSVPACNIDRREIPELRGPSRPRDQMTRVRGSQRSGIADQRGEYDMHARLPKTLMAIALIAPATPVSADVITDWNEKAVAFVTPRLPPPAAQRVVTMVQV